jgi:hypothetical protein
LSIKIPIKPISIPSTSSNSFFEHFLLIYEKNRFEQVVFLCS